MDTKKDFLKDINLFRGLAIILIVSSHILYLHQNSYFYSIISAFYLDSTLFFTFISGYLFYYNSDRYTYGLYIRKKAGHVILPYLVMSLPALAMRYFTGPSYFSLQLWPEVKDQAFLTQLGFYLSNGSHLVPFWYIPMISIFFIAAPILLKFKVHRKLFYLLPLFLIMSLFFDRTLTNFNNIPRMVAHFAFAYLFGMWYCEYRNGIDPWIRKHLNKLLVAFVLLFAITLIPEIPLRSQLITIQKLFSIPFILLLINRCSGFWAKTFDSYAKNSFGIYFIHFYFILAIRVLSAKVVEIEYPDRPLLWVICFLATLIASHYLVFAIRFVLKKRSRYLIGS